MTDGDNWEAPSPSAAVLTNLRGAYPAFKFSTEVIPGRKRRYTAQRIDGQRGLHTVVTPDLAELREVLDSR